MNRRLVKSMVSISFVLTMTVPPVFADISRSVTVSLCNNQVRGYCKASKDADDAFDRVLFKCQVLGLDHVPNLMGAANMDAELLKDVKMSAKLIYPRVGPLHAWHQYCRRITGVYPYSRIRFFPTPRLSLASLPDRQECVLNTGGGQLP